MNWDFEKVIQKVMNDDFSSEKKTISGYKLSKLFTRRFILCRKMRVRTRSTSQMDPNQRTMNGHKQSMPTKEPLMLWLHVFLASFATFLEAVSSRNVAITARPRSGYDSIAVNEYKMKLLPLKLHQRMNQWNWMNLRCIRAINVPLVSDGDARNSSGDPVWVFSCSAVCGTSIEHAHLLGIKVWNREKPNSLSFISLKDRQDSRLLLSLEWRLSFPESSSFKFRPHGQIPARNGWERKDLFDTENHLFGVWTEMIRVHSLRFLVWFSARKLL